jgi:hypothetical protein
MVMPRLFVCLLILLSGATQARTLEVGASRTFKAPSAAAAIARDGDRVAIDPGFYADCAVWNANNLVVEGVGDADKVVVADKTCQGKALFVTVGEGIAIRNLTLTGARVPDGNGAGIRAEGQNLTVEGVRFVGNQDGILSGTVGGSLTVRNSLFERNGACLAACAHGLYAGRFDLVRVENAHFIGTKEGHHIKSRARRTEVVGCIIEDGPDGTASYEIELPNGGALLARGNTITKGPKSGNHGAIISIGAEGAIWPASDIVVEGNKVRSDGNWDTYFVANRTATAAILRGNTLSGSVKPLRGEGAVR